ncbi:hypothetical protein, partial [Novosphingobium sp.]|uniref:hypothetical protein n=1 Tax=Novosphingobium sp. TaxID=1874826 RepID=UPI00261C3AD3
MLAASARIGSIKLVEQQPHAKERLLDVVSCREKQLPLCGIGLIRDSSRFFQFCHDPFAITAEQ